MLVISGQKSGLILNEASKQQALPSPWGGDLLLGHPHDASFTGDRVGARQLPVQQRGNRRAQ